MALAHFITHPDVVIDPAIPVPDWTLSGAGRARLAALPAEAWLADVRSIFSSSERKARETGEAIAAQLGLGLRVRPGLGEIDRSATGYLPLPELMATRERFYAEPAASARGWETAHAAQARIVAAVAAALAEAPPGDVALVAHGTVGALLRCHLMGSPVTAAEEQPRLGCVFAFPRAGGAPGGWRAL